MKMFALRVAVLAVGLWFGGFASAQDKIKALILDGQNNHKWMVTTPILKKLLEDSGKFSVEVATSPDKTGDISKYRPKFANYQVVISNYNGQDWSAETKKDLTDYVKNGGGFVSVHAANNAFPGWAEYNEIIGVGG